jgi:hypothetical protein
VISADDIQGHWRRNWLRAPGFEDTTTRVHWVQAGRWCADIRVPLIRPDVAKAGALAALSGPDLAMLLSAEGFAGHTTLAGDVCTWHRSWNWRGFPCPVDAGTLWFDDHGHLIEDGVHADYREEWQYVPAPAWRAWEVQADDADGMLISNERAFVLALGQRGSSASPQLAQALRDGTARADEAAHAFGSVYVMGRWQGGQGIAELSTQPFCEGDAVLTLDQTRAELTLPDFHGALHIRALRLSPVATE